jgi:3-hydroxypropanoate dehydrogenase
MANDVESARALGAACLRILFDGARTHRRWLPAPVDDGLLRRLYELTRLPPTASNCQPARLVFVKTPEAKARLRAALDASNVPQTMEAPVTVIVAHDMKFFEHLSRLVPNRPGLGERLAEKPEQVRERMAFQNASLQAGYLMLAARALGLDCGPMGGFNRERLDQAFFADTCWKSNLLVNLGYGDPAALGARAPRLEFEEACRIE